MCPPGMPSVSAGTTGSTIWGSMPALTGAPLSEALVIWTRIATSVRPQVLSTPETE